MSADVIAMARELGAALQGDPRYAAYVAARAANDADAELQDDIGQFNLVRLSIDKELAAEERDQGKIRELNERMRALYSRIMASPRMTAYNEAKTALDALVNDVTSIITMSANGDDPATCEPSRCTGSCETCGGCEG